jgi:lactate 2-monooxygenase
MTHSEVDPQRLSQPFSLPDSTSFSNFQRDIYQSFRPPLFSTNPAKWESLAKEKVPAANFGYVYGSASSAATAKANTEAFNRYRLRPRFLVDVTRRDVEVELFGTKYKSPLLVSPIGVQSILHPDAEEATARACHNVGVPMILSTAATRTIEQVANANADGDRWFQLYWPKPQYEEVTASLLARAKASGYKVLVVTLDTFSLGWRPTDLDTSYLPFVWGEGCQVGFSDPVFNQLFDEMQKNDSRGVGEKLAELWSIMRRPGTVYGAARVLANARTMVKSKAWIDVINSGTYREWAHLKILKELWDGPIVLKGIQTVEDAHLAIEHGMDGIIVSNHGGRQLDGAVASLDALAEIAADQKVKDSDLTIIFDSGVRTGSDVLKALALGANAVSIGRPYAYGLAAGGQQGVEHVLKCLLADMDNMLANVGKKSIRDLSRDDLQVLPLSKL